jgi:SAM-dependent methyltransferase
MHAMDTGVAPRPAHESPTADATTPAATTDEIHARIVAYYAVSTADYRVWSRGYNMHFGYWRRGINPLRREALLDETNQQVLARLQLPADRPVRVADLGGGTGATARSAVARMANLAVDVVTLSPTQVELGARLNAQAPNGAAVAMHCMDYEATTLESGAYDGVCCVESACHAPGATKAGVLAEAYRLLKPGGRLVLVDAWLTRPVPEDGPLRRILARVYRRWCVSWAVPEMGRADLLPDALRAAGFEDARVEDWSWRVAPSVAHVPVLASWFAVAEIVKARGRLPPWRWRHIVASALTPLLGLYRSTFMYGAVTARKPLA